MLRARNPVLLLTLALAGTAAGGTTWHVDDDAPGDPGPGDPAVSDPLEDGTAGRPFDAIQEAIDAANSGDVVLVAAGTYTGDGNRDMSYGGRDITVQAASAPAVVTIDCQGANDDPHRAFTFENGETAAARLVGVRIVGGRVGKLAPVHGGAILCVDASPSIENCIFEGNRTSDDACCLDDERRGGAVFNDGGSPAFTGCTFLANRATDGDSGLGGAVASVGGAVHLSACTFLGNTTDSDVTRGAAVFVRDGDTTIAGCAFQGNSQLGLCAGMGGAVYLEGRGATTITACVFEGNRTSGGGACGGGGSGHGGAVWNGQAGTVIDDCLFSQNRSAGYHASSGGAIHAGAPLTIRRSRFLDNWTVANVFGVGTGGAVRFDADASESVIHDCLLVRSEAAGDDAAYGGAMDSAAPVTVTNCTIVDSTTEGGPPVGAALHGSFTITNSILRGSTPAEIGGGAAIAWSNVLGGAPGPGNIDADPLFLAPLADDYRLGPGSPCIDAGDNTAVPPGTATDLAGEDRFVDDPVIADTGNGIAPIVDMGAFEWQAIPFADANGDAVVDVNDLVLVIEDWGPCPRRCAGDVNGDGVADVNDLVLVIVQWGLRDCNGNSVDDPLDIAYGTSPDCNGNGVPDECDVADGTSDDCDGNGVPDDCDPDCNGNGTPDACDIAGGASPDCNGNGVPDECDLDGGTSPDCNDNGVPDECDVAEATSPDCNGNGVPDECDIAFGFSHDCNRNGVPDDCDVDEGTSPDCDGNGVPDECDLAAGTSPDCNDNGVPDECDIAGGTSADCNGNGVPDECDIADGTSNDCDRDGVPDECGDDCNDNGVADSCDIADGTSDDVNGNGVPDECELVTADNCTSPAPGVAFPLPFSTLAATTDGPLEACFDGSGQADHDVWLRWTATCTGPVTLDICDADFDTRLAVYHAFCPAGPDTALACGDDECGDRSQLTFAAATGTIYRIRIGGRDGTAGTGSIQLSCE